MDQFDPHNQQDYLTQLLLCSMEFSMKKSLLWNRTGLESTRSVQSYRLPARKERCDGKDYAGRCRIKGRGSPKQLGLDEIIFAKKKNFNFREKN